MNLTADEWAAWLHHETPTPSGLFTVEESDALLERRIFLEAQAMRRPSAWMHNMSFPGTLVGQVGLFGDVADWQSPPCTPHTVAIRRPAEVETT